MSTIREIYDTMEYGPAPESASPALAWIAAHADSGRFGLYIDGGWQTGHSGEFFDTINPATGATLASITQAGAEDVDWAVEAAAVASVPWQALGTHRRARYLYAIARHIQKHSRLLAVLETLDNGKPIRESRDIDIPLAARHFYHHAGWAQLMDTEFAGYGPVGVVGQIIPWNFPLLMLAWKVAPALATGNTVVLKPAEDTSLTALAFAWICSEIGLPAGVVNIVTGDGKVGEQIVNHPGVQKIAFTGSTEVGRAIRRATAGSGKRLSLELGGKSPFIVFDDADLDSAVEGLVDAIWFNQGQVCCAGSRLLMHEGISERLVRKVRARMETLRVGDPLDKTTDMGAIVSHTQYKRIEGLVASGKEDGAEVWQSGCITAGKGSSLFYPPTLITGLSPSAKLAQEEIFGPVLVAMSFRTQSEAVELANNTRYGLAASVWTENINLALEIAPRLKAGTVWINCTNVFDAGAGFGGYRESGFGREGGREGLFEYLVALPAPDSSVQEQLETTAPQYPVGGAIASISDLSTPAIDRTPKLFIGGKQVRPDSGYSVPVYGPSGVQIGEVGEGSRKDNRNAVEAARAASGWASTTAHLKAQILYYLAENLEVRAGEFAGRLVAQTGCSLTAAGAEVEQSIERIFTFAALADKYEGTVHPTPFRNVTLAMPEPIGIIGISCPSSSPLLGFIGAVVPAIAMGNTVVVTPSEEYPLSATDLYQVFETSDLPAGVVNIVTGKRDALAEIMAAHDEISAVWYWGTQAGAAKVETLSAANLKRTWVHREDAGVAVTPDKRAIDEMLREATQIKNIWCPYGD